MTNAGKTTLYIGVTSNLLQRINQHQQELVDGFSKKYHTHLLVYYEEYPTIIEAIQREKQLKNRKRAWKNNLITESNPQREDLSGRLE